MKTVRHNRNIGIKVVVLNYFHWISYILGCVGWLVLHIKPWWVNTRVRQHIVHTLCLTHNLVTSLPSAENGICVRRIVKIWFCGVNSATQNYWRSPRLNLSTEDNCSWVFGRSLTGCPHHCRGDNRTVNDKNDKADIHYTKNYFSKQMLKAKCLYCSVNGRN